VIVARFPVDVAAGALVALAGLAVALRHAGSPGRSAPAAAR
jgi:hypothetical protein